MESSGGTGQFQKNGGKAHAISPFFFLNRNRNASSIFHSQFAPRDQLNTSAVVSNNNRKYSEGNDRIRKLSFQNVMNKMEENKNNSNNSQEQSHNNSFSGPPSPNQGPIIQVNPAKNSTPLVFE